LSPFLSLLFCIRIGSAIISFIPQIIRQKLSHSDLVLGLVTSLGRAGYPNH